MDNLNIAGDFSNNKQYETLEDSVPPGERKFLALIAHDIKTPIGTVISYLSMLKKNMHKWEREFILGQIEIVLYSAERTYALLNNLLEWANAENIFKSYQPEIFDFNKILNIEIDDTKLYTMQKNITINSLVVKDGKVFADINMVKSILRNLLVNAIKYSHKSGKIDITSKRDDGFLEVTIKDYGVGINPNAASTFFSAKNYISTLGTDKEPGTGYGLLLCKELIEINKGNIWIIANADKGSEFKFTLPLMQSTF